MSVVVVVVVITFTVAVSVAVAVKFAVTKKFTRWKPPFSKSHLHTKGKVKILLSFSQVSITVSIFHYVLLSFVYI